MDKYTALIVQLADGSHRITQWYRSGVTRLEIVRAYRDAICLTPAHRVELLDGISAHVIPLDMIDAWTRDAQAEPVAASHATPLDG